VVIATTSVGAVAGGLIRHRETGWVIPPADPQALAQAIDLLLSDAPLRARLGSEGRRAVAGHTYAAMVSGFDRALGAAAARY
jgi:glycosyltransferase involved in cell wall biosynthesis